MNLGNQFDNNQFTHSPSVPHVSHDNDGRDNHYALNLDELGTFAQADLSAWDDPTSSSLNPATIFHDHAKQQPSLPPQSFSAPQSAQFHSPYSAQQYLDPSVGTSTISHGFPNSANVFQQHQPSTTTNAATVAPGALQSNQFNPTQQSPRPAPVQQRGPSGSLTSPYHPAQLPPVPAGNRVGRFYSIPLDLVKAKTHSRAINPFVALGSAAYDIPTTKSTLPHFHRRKSRNEIKVVVRSDPQRSASYLKRSSKGVLHKDSASTRKDATKRLVQGSSAQSPTESSSEEESSGETESESESSEEGTPQAPLPSARPTTPLEATQYDAIKALWRPPGRPLDRKDVFEAIEKFWELIQTIKNRWSSDTEQMQNAAKAKKEVDIPLLQERVDKQLLMLEKALTAAVQHGHADILANFHGHMQMIAAIGSFLRDRVVKNDYKGPLVHAILDLFSRLTSLTAGDLERTKVTKLLQRTVKWGDELSKRLSKKILDNGNQATKKNFDSTKASSSTSSKSEIQPKLSPATGTKRRNSDTSEVPPQKKFANPDPSRKQDATAQAAKKDTNSAPSAVKVQKAKEVTVKPSSFFSSIKSASKVSQTSKPSAEPDNARTSSATQSAGSKDVEMKDMLPTTNVSAKAPVSNFALAMANVAPSQTKPKAPTRSEKPRETPHEKARRERKESRRHLRVCWAPEKELVKVHTYEGESDDELDHDASQVRDVGSLKNEALMFRHESEKQKHNVDLAEDEDVDLPRYDDHSRPFGPISRVDWSSFPSEDLQYNYERFGGPEKPDCPEAAVQREREALALIAIYTDSSDIPPSPQEPVSDASRGENPPKAFGPVDKDFAIERFKVIETEPAGRNHDKIETFMDYISKYGRRAWPETNAKEQASEPSDITKILAQLQQATANSKSNPANQAPQISVPPLPTQQPNDPSGFLAQILSAPQNSQNWFSSQTQNVSQNNFPPPSQQGDFPYPGNFNMFNQSNAPNPMASMNWMSSFPGMPVPGMMSVPNAASMPGAPMSQMPTSSDPASFASFMMPPMPNAPAPFAPNAGGMNNSQGDSSTGGQQFENPARRDQREQSNRGVRRNKNPPTKIYTCKFWEQGSCKKGEACTYRHDYDGLPNPNK